MKRWPLWIVTFGGTGLLKPAPGTWGSLAAIVVFAIAHHWISLVNWPWFLLVCLFAASAANVMLGRWIIRNLGKDPGPCVIDEAAGIALTLIGLPMVHPVIAFALAFGAFRLFDVTKIYPARQLEALPAGWGILFDDLAAAIYANLTCEILLRLF